MPKRSNDFQRLVFLIREQLKAPEWLVRELLQRRTMVLGIGITRGNPSA
jgi:hypothetical protein